VSGTGMVMAFNPDDPHDGHAAGDGGFTYRMVHIWPEFFASLTGTARQLPLFRSPVLDDPVTARSLRRLHLALTRPEAGTTELERYERLAGTARLLVRHSAAGARAAGPAETAGSDTRVAARIRELLHDRYAAAHLTAPDLTSTDLTAAELTSTELTSPELTSTDLAAAAGCSRYAAYRAFRQVYGLAPSDYQRQLRVRAARGLLARGAAPAVAAAEAGFADQAHLTRWFRRYYGVTPGAYRAAMHPRAGVRR
jgi:AraC-like DNA-binding protein